MKRIWLFALALVFVLAIPQSARCQENATSEMKDGEPVYRPGQGITPPRRISGSEPEYDDESRKAKTSGTVILSIIVTNDGQTTDIKVEKSLSPRLDQQAIKAVSKWRFQPATKNGETVAIRVSVEADFRIR